MPPPQSKRSAWPIAIISFFAVAIVGILIFIFWAVRQNMDLVRKDYYAQDIRYQQQFDRVQRAQQLNSAATIRYAAAAQEIVIVLPSTQSHQHTTGFVHFYRPSDAALDQTMKLAVDEKGTQKIDVKTLRAGHWKIRVYWNVQDEEFYYEESLVLGGGEV